MEDKWIRIPMELILAHADDNFVDRLMKEVDTNPRFKKLLEDLISRPAFKEAILSYVENTPSKLLGN